MARRRNPSGSTDLLIVLAVGGIGLYALSKVDPAKIIGDLLGNLGKGIGDTAGNVGQAVNPYQQLNNIFTMQNGGVPPNDEEQAMLIQLAARGGY